MWSHKREDQILCASLFTLSSFYKGNECSYHTQEIMMGFCHCLVVISSIYMQMLKG